MAKYTELCNSIIDAVGGKDNVLQAFHCMTRLRVNVKDKNLVNLDQLKATKGVINGQFIGDQLQVIIGTHVGDVYAEFCPLAEVSAEAAVDENLDTIKEPFDIKKVPSKILEALSGTIGPILPILLGTGFMKLIATVIGPDMLKLVSADSNIYQSFYIVGNAGFYFLPVFTAWSAARKFDTSIPMALILGVLLIDPNILDIVGLGEPFKVYGAFPMALHKYSSQFLPTILTVWILSYVYKFFNEHVPSVVKVFGVPLCTLLVMVPLEFCVLAPLGYNFGTAISWLINGLYSFAGPFALLIVGALWQFLVATGMHMAIVPLAISNFATLGYDPVILVGGDISNYALMGLEVAYLIKSKGETKQVATANALTHILGGISEPTLFSLLIVNKRAIVYQLIGGGISSFIAGLFKFKIYSLGASNFMTFVCFAGPGNNMPVGIVCSIIAFAITLALGLVFGFDDKKKDAA